MLESLRTVYTHLQNIGEEWQGKRKGQTLAVPQHCIDSLMTYTTYYVYCGGAWSLWTKAGFTWSACKHTSEVIVLFISEVDGRFGAILPKDSFSAFHNRL